jgi:3-phenylpropionate/cinnamic acid dioxygenase small subunit
MGLLLAPLRTSPLGEQWGRGAGDLHRGDGSAQHGRVQTDADAIRALLFAYAERLDVGDLDGVAALFEHATWRSLHRPEPLRGSAAVRRAYDVVRLHAGSPRTKHVITNVVVEVYEAPGRAAARSYFTVFQALADFPLQAIACGRYHDTFECVRSVWRFTDRLILADLQGDLSRHLTSAAIGTPARPPM